MHSFCQCFHTQSCVVSEIPRSNKSYSVVPTSWKVENEPNPEEEFEELKSAAEARYRVKKERRDLHADPDRDSKLGAIF